MRLPLRHAPALADAPLSASLASFYTVVVCGMTVFIAGLFRPESPSLAYVVGAWVGVSVILLSGHGASVRGGQLELSLPIDARDIWRRHVVARAVAGAGGIAIGLAVVLFAGVVAYVVMGPDVAFYRAAAGSTLLLVSGLVLVVPLLEIRDLRHASRSRAWWARASDALILAAVLALLVFIHATVSIAWSLLVAATGLALGAWIDGTLPASFLLHPPAAQRTREGHQPDDVRLTPGARRRTPSWITTWRAVRGVRPLLTDANVLLSGIVLAEGLVLFTRNTGYLMIVLPFAAMIAQQMMAIVPFRTAALYRFDHFPISRRRLFAAIVLPAMALILVGFAAGRGLASRADWNRETVRLERSGGGVQVSIPLRLYQISWSGDVPAFTAPWGESAPAIARSLTPNGRVVAYAPYGIANDSSLEFVALQLSRAAKDVYGVVIDPAHIAETYLRRGGDGVVRLRDEFSFLRDDRPDLAPPGRGPLAFLLLFTVVPSGLLLMAALLRFVRADVTERSLTRIFWLLSSIPFVFALGVWLLPVVGFHAGAQLVTMVEVMAYRYGRGPGAMAALCVVGILLTALAYKVAERQFRRAEFLRQPLSFGILSPPKRLDP